MGVGVWRLFASVVRQAWLLPVVVTHLPLGELTTIYSNVDLEQFKRKWGCLRGKGKIQRPLDVN